MTAIKLLSRYRETSSCDMSKKLKLSLNLAGLAAKSQGPASLEEQALPDKLSPHYPHTYPQSVDKYENGV